MGTSQSSGGPGSGIAMVPPWVPDPPVSSKVAEPASAEALEGPDEAIEGQPEAGNAAISAAPPIPIAPAARFLGARRNLGDFARDGDARELRRGLGHYVRSGYGGTSTTLRRFGGTAVTASALGGVLANVAAGQAGAPGSSLDPTLLAGKSAQEVMDAVVETVRPIDGTQDAEAARAAIRDALSELLTRFPDADLLNLDVDQRNFVIERFTAIDVYRRFELDVGRAIVEKAPTATVALSRLKQARDYIKETIAASFRKLRDAGRPLTSGKIVDVVRAALRDAFEIFEGYAE